ncbi:MAG: DNA-binding phage protein [Chlamydiales bacterium]|jgi:DNA-binding phage protein
MQQKSSKTTPRKLKLKKRSKASQYSPTEKLLDEDFISKAIWECLKNNDPEGVIEVLEAHIEALNKVQFAEKAEVPRSTLYHSFTSKNPTIKTLAKIIHTCVT